MRSESQRTPEMVVDLARRIRAARHLQGKKGKALADELGWQQDKLYRMETGRQVPDAFELAAIARVTSLPLDYFYGTTSPSGDGARVLTGSDAESKSA